MEKHDYKAFISPKNKTEIIEQFDDFIDEAAKIDTVIFYFSGHGDTSRGELLLVLDENIHKSKSTFNINYIIEAFKACRACNKLIILDCCRAGAVTDTWNPEQSERYRILTASERLEQGKELEEFKASFLTYHIYKALVETPSDIINQENRICINELYKWLIRKAEEHNGASTHIKVPLPNLLGNQKANFEIANIKKKFSNIIGYSLDSYKIKKENQGQPNFGFCKFIYTTITGRGLLDLDQCSSPYSAIFDPTDPYQLKHFSKIYAFLWMPTTQCIRSLPLQHLTPVAAICTLNPDQVVDILYKKLEESLLKQLDKPPSKLRNEEKFKLINAMAEALTHCFAIAVTISSLVLGIGRAKPELAYQAIPNLFFLPLLERHRRLEFKQFHVRLSEVGEKSSYLLKSTKSIVKASFPKKNSYSVDFLTEEDNWGIIKNISRMLAWTVGSLYNSGNPCWVNLLEKSIKQQESQILSS